MDPNNDHLVAAAEAGAPAAVAATAAAAEDEEQDAAASNEILLQQAISILQHQQAVPVRTRNKIIELARAFVDGVRDDVHDMITDTRTEEQGYTGLDSDRDTEKEVEKAIRFYPESLTRRGGKWNEIPCQCLIYVYNNTNDKCVVNVKAVSFIHLFVRLAIEFNLFAEEERGGLLLTEDGEDEKNVLQDLAGNSHSSYDEHHHQLVDTTVLVVLLRLRQSGYFVREDIQQYQLVEKLCMHKKQLAHKRFRFLVAIDPSSVLLTNQYGGLPFHWAARRIRKFRSVCDAVFRFYPKWRGIQLLHQKTVIHRGRTPFRSACKHIGHTAVSQIVEETLARYSDTVLPDIPQALILSATDERIHLDCVYFLMRRRPDVVLNMIPRYRQGSGSLLLLSSSTDNNTNRTSNSNNNDDTGRILRRSTRKRKRN